MASLRTPKAAFEFSPGARFQSKLKDVKLDLRNIHWSVTEKQALAAEEFYVKKWREEGMDKFADNHVG